MFSCEACPLCNRFASKFWVSYNLLGILFPACKTQLGNLAATVSFQALCKRWKLVCQVKQSSQEGEPKRKVRCVGRTFQRKWLQFDATIWLLQFVSLQRCVVAYCNENEIVSFTKKTHRARPWNHGDRTTDRTRLPDICENRTFHNLVRWWTLVYPPFCQLSCVENKSMLAKTPHLRSVLW